MQEVYTEEVQEVGFLYCKLTNKLARLLAWFLTPFEFFDRATIIV